jgi:hypothetical protein
MPYVNIEDIMTLDQHDAGKNINTCRIGLELGQREWRAVYNCPPAILEKAGVTYLRRWDGPLEVIKEQALEEMGKVATIAMGELLYTNVIYEAGAFGQQLGRDMYGYTLMPWQVVPRNIEYIRFGPSRAPRRED